MVYLLLGNPFGFRLHRGNHHAISLFEALKKTKGMVDQLVKGHSTAKREAPVNGEPEDVAQSIGY